MKMKVKVVETCEVKRVYTIETDSAEVDGEGTTIIDTDEVLSKLYSGNIEPDLEEEDGNEITMYDENDKVIPS